MKNIVHTISLACGLLCAPLLNAQGIFSTSELYKSPRSLAMGGITTASRSQRILRLRECIGHSLLRPESGSWHHV